MKKILLSMLLISSVVIFAGCNQKDTTANENMNTNPPMATDQNQYNAEQMGNNEVVVTETETIEEVPAQQ